jgi:SAM-dependent methyltransferase
MTVSAIELYGDALHDDRSHPGDFVLRYLDGRRRSLDVHRWLGPADDADAVLLGRCRPATLDVGCGPGRLVGALNAAGHRALGIDIARSAVRIARFAGAPVVRRSIFDETDDDGSWRTVLLADGNIGIGGDPVGLLRRCSRLLTGDGHVVVELEPPGTTSAAVTVRLESSGDHSAWFPWAHVAADAIDGVADHAGLGCVERWNVDGRWFAVLARR